MKPIVFIDMDGVLADLDLGMFNMFGEDVKKNNSSNKLFNYYFPEYVNNRGFENQPLRENSDYLVNRLVSIQPKVNLAILTSTGTFYSSLSEVSTQKRIWLETNFPAIINIPFITTSSGKDKAMLAHKKAFLIDDVKRNCNVFIEAGGSAHWYTKTDNCNIDILLDEIDQFYRGIKDDE